MENEDDLQFLANLVNQMPPKSQDDAKVPGDNVLNRMIGFYKEKAAESGDEWERHIIPGNPANRLTGIFA